MLKFCYRKKKKPISFCAEEHVVLNSNIFKPHTEEAGSGDTTDQDGTKTQISRWDTTI